MSNYRPLSTIEIQALEEQLCTCNDWENIKVAESFTPKNIVGVSFSGKIQLGVFQKEFTLQSGIVKKAGIYNASIHNCKIGNDVYISHITNQIANYKIDANCFIENVDLLETLPQSTFGNGVKVAVLDETGSREVTIFEKITSTTAYLFSTYKHNTTINNTFNKIIQNECNKKQSNIGHIKSAAQIKNCTTIINVNIGESSKIEGVSLLKNGTICSNADAPTTVGHQVIAKDFIIGKGSTIIDGCQIDACYIGESCLMGKQFSAMHSLFFSNCEMLHGEAVSVFAGPFSVSHHKSTLLIGGMFSFFNAGSGSNMSNHMYKLGPIHYGVMQRGCKMSSDSYLMWPGKIGVFSVIIGKIKKHIDTSKLPFSYIIDNKGEYNIMPGMNLTSIGTYRDSQKWKKRDGRKNTEKLDNINFDFLNPYIISQLQEGIKTLTELKEKNPKAISLNYKGCRISVAFIEKGISLYQMMIDIYLGKQLLKKEQSSNTTGTEAWVDAGGQTLPKNQLNDFINNIKTDFSIDKLNKALYRIHIEIDLIESNWVKEKFISDKSTRIKNAISAIEKYKNILVSDAQKEFSSESKICFGLDQSLEEKEVEFNEIRGKANENSIILEVERNCQETIKLLEKL